DGHLRLGRLRRLRPGPPAAPPPAAQDLPQVLAAHAAHAAHAAELPQDLAEVARVDVLEAAEARPALPPAPAERPARAGLGPRAVEAEPVVLLPLRLVVQDVVGLLRLLEAGLGRLVPGVPVGVVLPGQLAVGLLDVRLR